MTKRARSSTEAPSGDDETPRSDRPAPTPRGRGKGTHKAGSAPGKPAPPKARAQREHSAGGVVVQPAAPGTPARYLLIRDSYENWGFPKGHVERDEPTERAALREVEEETGLTDVQLRGLIDTIDWWFKFRGRLIHKVCDFYLMVVPPGAPVTTAPQQAEGISACEWLPYEAARSRLSYANARDVLARAQEMVAPLAGGPADALSRSP